MSPSLTTLQHIATDLDPSGAVAVHFAAPRSLRFTAGQHGLWFVPGGGAKPCTIASAPEEDVVTLATDPSSGSRFKRALGALHDGSSVRFAGPVGGFTLDPDAEEVVMLAQGIGITPFRSILRHTTLAGLDVRTTLVHVAAHHPFQDDTAARAVAAHYPRSREAFTARVTEVTRAHPQAAYMVSGTPTFVSSTTATLKASGIHRRHIARDAFYGIPQRTGTPSPLAAR